MRLIALSLALSLAAAQAAAAPVIEPDKTPCQILHVFVAFDGHLRPEVEAYLNGMLAGVNPDLDEQWKFIEAAAKACNAAPESSLADVFKAAR